MHLIGRTEDLRILRRFFESAGSGGTSLLLAGAAGVGKTALLDAAAEEAAKVDMAVLRAGGVESESGVAGAGLHQLLLPLFDLVPRLRIDYRRALDAVLGFGPRQSVNRLTAASAVLHVVRERAADRPLMILIDDLHSMDQTSSVVLGMVARRLAGSRLGLLAAVSTNAECVLQTAGLPRHELQPLEKHGAAELLDTSFPGLPARVRRRVLSAAQGNPLALLELPALLGPPRQSLFTPPADGLWLSHRLEEVFAGRIRLLPAKTRYLLLLVALAESGDLASGTPIEWSATDLAPAEHQRLVHVDPSGRRIVFRHPLLASTVIQTVTSAQRRQAHRVLAELVRDRPERRAWHLAHAASGPNEHVAALLERAGNIALLHGDGVSAVAALIRASRLSPSPRARGDRLARAAYLGAAVTGDLKDVAALIDETRVGVGDPSPHTVVAAYVTLNAEGDIDTAHRLVTGWLNAPAGAIDQEGATLDAALHTLLLACSYGGRADLWKPLDTALDRCGSRVQPLLVLLRDTVADPARRAAAAGRLTAAISALDGELDPTRIVRTATAAHYVGRTGECRNALWRIVRDGREGGAVTSAIDALRLLGFDSLWSGDWEEADSLIAESLRLCDAHGYRALSWSGLFGRALLAAMRGDRVAASSGADRLHRWAAPLGARSLLEFAGQVRTMDQLGHGEFETAYRHAAVSAAGALASCAPHAIWLIFDLVEAAVHTGRQAEARAQVAAARAAGFDTISPRLTLLTVAADAVAAPMPAAEELFETALAGSDAGRWVFDSARVRLAYGERLRRARATARAREQLLDARETFQRLGAEPWATRAGCELRATGYNAGRGKKSTAGDGACRLTARDLEIASLAASGLSNKQIARLLFLSDRTVSAHLYRLFPRLGITSRAALRDALDSLPASQV